MSGCLDNAQCPQFECFESEKRNQFASVIAGALVRVFNFFTWIINIDN